MKVTVLLTLSDFTVMVAFRSFVSGLGTHEQFKTASPDPVEGETLSQEAFDDAVHAQFAIISISVVPEPASIAFSVALKLISTEGIIFSNTSSPQEHMSNDENNSNDNLAFILILGGGFNTTKLVIKSQKTAPIGAKKPVCAGILKHGISGIDGISQVFSGIKENTASNCNEQRACAAIH